MPTVLIIDDNPSIAIALDVLLSLHDIKSITAESPEDGLILLKNNDVDLVIQDMNFTADTTSGEEGISLFKKIREQHPDLPVILLTAWTHLDMAVDLIKAGAADYLAKPWKDARLVATVQNLIELGQANRALQQRVQRERQQKRVLETQYDMRDFVWQDAATERVLGMACQVARSHVSVLITGPNGAGKERIAEVIQANSPVKNGPFVVLNCGAIPSELIEAELFGAEAGAYTGAVKAREGKFEAADGGTLFLDEIGNLPLSGQIKLLRVLETGRFERLGSNKERQVKVRVISATNADLAGMIKDGRFREDLYYRLNVIELNLPALADRPDDILVLANFFIEKNTQLNIQVNSQPNFQLNKQAEKFLHPQAQAALLQHTWPGNVRELKNVIQRACLLANKEQIMPADLGLPIMQTIPKYDQIDEASIEQALLKARGVVAQAAADLGLSRQALYRRMDRLGIRR